MDFMLSKFGALPKGTFSLATDELEAQRERQHGTWARLNWIFYRGTFTASRIILIVVVLLLLTICYSANRGRRFTAKEFDLDKQLMLLKKKLSKEEELEFEKQLKLLNKPAVEIIQTKYGESYACVDFYKQPAFDHPSLKNHTFPFLMKPTKDQYRSMGRQRIADMWLNGKGCPSGTVPIKRVSKDGLIRAKLATEIYASKMNPLAGDVDQTGAHYALVRTQADSNKKYTGGGMFISVYEPLVQDTQYSSGRIRIQNGWDFVEVGWMVNPALYKDSHAHLFVFTNATDSHCFDTLCPGMVVVNPVAPLGSIIPEVSTRGGTIMVLKVVIYKDAANGNWYLNLGPEETQVGFWPQKIFTGLEDGATYIEWGGETYSPRNRPPMGSGKYPIKNTNYDGYCAQITTYDENHQVRVADNTEVFMNGGPYLVLDEGNQKGYFQHLVLFGGPGDM